MNQHVAAARAFLIFGSIVLLLLFICVNFVVTDQINRPSMAPIAFFNELLCRQLDYRIDIVVWDLDCTLGDCPGWDGIMSAREYTHHPETLTSLLAYIRRHCGARNILVSNNSMFCGDAYEPSARQFHQLGFDMVVACNRCTDPSMSKICRLLHVDPDRILLIDDQLGEVSKVVEVGGYAMHVGSPIFTAIRTGDFVVYGPDPSAQYNAPKQPARVDQRVAQLQNRAPAATRPGTPSFLRF